MATKFTRADFIKAIQHPKDAPRPPRPSVAFVGRSNVGKSSLINSLLGRKNLARTSSTPGRTQAIHYYEINERYYFIDLPGYGYAKAPEKVRGAWQRMIRGFLRNAEDLRLVIVILDMRRTPTAQDREMIAWLNALRLTHLFAVTKADKLGKTKIPAQLKAIQEKLNLPDQSALAPYSSQTGLGRKDLIRVLVETLESRPGV